LINDPFHFENDPSILEGFFICQSQHKSSLIFQSLVKQAVFKASHQSMRMGIVFGISGA